MRIKIQQINIDIFSNQILLELIDYLFQFIKIKMPILNNLKLEDITYKDKLLIVVTSSSMEKTFRTNPLILI